MNVLDTLPSTVTVLVQREMDIGGSGYRSQKSKLTNPHRLRLPAGLKSHWVAPANDPKMMTRTPNEAKGSWSRLLYGGESQAR